MSLSSRGLVSLLAAGLMRMRIAQPQQYRGGGEDVLDVVDL
ncbi:MAG: hypothetical protein QM433_08110 [Euryarchaeota archaeon]|nr:hypothetical protein [Euryarchaeota archaeon]